MSKCDADEHRDWTFESFWQVDIKDAREGGTRDTRTVLKECIRFLRGQGFVFRSENWDRRIPIDKKGYPPKGYVPEPLCSFLIESLEAALTVPSKQVGKAMRIGNPHQRDSEYEKTLSTFVNHYSYLMDQYDRPEFTEKQQHAMVMEEVASLMNKDLRSVQRYFNDAGGSRIRDVGYPWEYNPYETEED